MISVSIITGKTLSLGFHPQLDTFLNGGFLLSLPFEFSNVILSDNPFKDPHQIMLVLSSL
jgi:hypothetical protein